MADFTHATIGGIIYLGVFGVFGACLGFLIQVRALASIL